MAADTFTDEGMALTDDWRECSEDDNPFGLTDWQRERVTGYLKDNFTIDGKPRTKREGHKSHLCFNPIDKECFGDYDENHNFCLNICGARTKCKEKK